ncbi:G-rich sequence factor 1 [Nematolebias whitei]|uniref:G-rich sequence factor 1 n=1 Tax=Nematolebias whitei TaxID=451745 RepID=UPI00189AE44A|nr:G-rich sequence factor 1 [Nematolebias whitei]
MSGTGTFALSLLRRCVAVSRLPVRVASVRWSFVQHRTWTSQTRYPQPAITCTQHRFCTKAEPPYEEEYPPLPAYQPQSEPEAQEVYIIQVKGLSWSCTEMDLLNFFSDCKIHDGEMGVHLVPDQLGRPSGQAFIKLEHEEDVVKALGKHRQYLGSRYVEVYEVTNSEAETILLKAADTGGHDGVVLLRGLPFSCREDDIQHFFSGLDIKENGITFVTNSRGRNSGEAYVQFSSQEEAEKALQKHREFIGTRYIEVFPSSRDSIRSTSREKEWSSAPQQMYRREGSDFQPNSKRAPVFPQSSNASNHFVHMRGLPFRVSVEEIVMFFAPLVVSKVVTECGPNGRPKGEADVYFSNHRDAIKAMSRDRMYIGNRYVELFLNSEETLD